jgi:hypothetical protein
MDKRLDACAERLALRSIGTVDVAHQVDHQIAMKVPAKSLVLPNIGLRPAK